MHRSGYRNADLVFFIGEDSKPGLMLLVCLNLVRSVRMPIDKFRILYSALLWLSAFEIIKFVNELLARYRR